jgi:hypothetical protein
MPVQERLQKVEGPQKGHMHEEAREASEEKKKREALPTVCIGAQVHQAG